MPSHWKYSFKRDLDNLLKILWKIFHIFPPVGKKFGLERCSQQLLTLRVPYSTGRAWSQQASLPNETLIPHAKNLGKSNILYSFTVFHTPSSPLNNYQQQQHEPHVKWKRVPQMAPSQHTRIWRSTILQAADITHFKHEKIPTGLPGNQPSSSWSWYSEVFVLFPCLKSTWQVKDKLD